MRAVNITVDSPQTNRYGLWQFYPAVTSAGSLRTCSQESAEKTLADLRIYPHTEQPSRT